MAASISATMFLWGILSGVGANLGPFSKMDSIPHKNIVAKIEAAISNLPDKSKDAIRTSAASLLQRSQIPNHKNTTADECKAILQLKKDKTCVIMKADKGNCFIVMD
jgi:type IV secretory pathway TraG/TraD family ATPase VirD4